MATALPPIFSRPPRGVCRGPGGVHGPRGRFPPRTAKTANPDGRRPCGAGPESNGRPSAGDPARARRSAFSAPAAKGRRPRADPRRGRASAGRHPHRGGAAGRRSRRSDSGGRSRCTAPVVLHSVLLGWGAKALVFRFERGRSPRPAHPGGAIRMARRRPRTTPPEQPAQFANGAFLPTVAQAHNPATFRAIRRTLRRSDLRAVFTQEPYNGAPETSGNSAAGIGTPHGATRAGILTPGTSRGSREPSFDGNRDVPLPQKASLFGRKLCLRPRLRCSPVFPYIEEEPRSNVPLSCYAIGGAPKHRQRRKSRFWVFGSGRGSRGTSSPTTRTPPCGKTGAGPRSEPTSASSWAEPYRRGGPVFGAPVGVPNATGAAPKGRLRRGAPSGGYRRDGETRRRSLAGPTGPPASAEPTPAAEAAGGGNFADDAASKEPRLYKDRFRFAEGSAGEKASPAPGVLRRAVPGRIPQRRSGASLRRRPPAAGERSPQTHVPMGRADRRGPKPLRWRKPAPAPGDHPGTANNPTRW